MAVIDRVFPENLSYGSAGGPQGLTRILTGPDGVESRSGKLSVPRRRYEAAAGVRTYADLMAIRDFFYQMKGAEQAFLFEPPDSSTAANGRDAPSMLDVVLERIADTQYRIARRYQTGTEELIVPIKYPIESSIVVSIDGASTTSFSHSLGVLTIPSLAGDASSVVRAGWREYVQARFGGDEWLSVSEDDFGSGSLSIEVVEVIDEPLVPAMYVPGGIKDLSIDGPVSLEPWMAFAWRISASLAADVNLPNMVGLADGEYFIVSNVGSFALTVKDSGGSTVTTLDAGESCHLFYGSGPGWYFVG
jgi:uncharacterized protein (TIGR02217 family)